MENIRFLTEDEMLLVAGAGFFEDDDEIMDPFESPDSGNTIVCYPSGNSSYPYNCQSYNAGGGSFTTYPQQNDISTPDSFGRSPQNNYTPTSSSSFN